MVSRTRPFISPRGTLPASATRRKLIDIPRGSSSHSSAWAPRASRGTSAGRRCPWFVGRPGLTASLMALGTALLGCGDKPAGPARAQIRSAHAVFRASPVPAPAGAFDADSALFPRKRAAGFLDWAAVHHEADQSFQDYVEEAPTRPNATRRVIVLQPIGPFSPADSELLDTLSDYLGIYFQLETRVADPIPLPTLGMRTRDEDDRVLVQYRTDILLYQLLQ